MGVRRGRVGAHVSPTDESVHWMFFQKVEPTVRGKNGEERGNQRRAPFRHRGFFPRWRNPTASDRSGAVSRPERRSNG